MTSWECYENKWFYIKYIGKMAETESLLSTCCTWPITYLTYYRHFNKKRGDHRDCDRMVIEFTTTYAISAYHH
jgi:hypothetical protein